MYKQIPNCSAYEISISGDLRYTENQNPVPTVINKGTRNVNLKTDDGKWLKIKVQKLVDELFPEQVQGTTIAGATEYKITKDGQVYSLVTSRWSKLTQGKHGYYVVTLRQDNGVKRRFDVHRLVADAYVEGKFDSAYVNHKNGNKLDNRAENLEWCTNEENLQHAWSTGLMDNKHKGCRISCNGYVWVEFPSLKMAKAYIEENTEGGEMPNVSKLSRCAKWNAEKEAEGKVPNHTVRGYTIKYT